MFKILDKRNGEVTAEQQAVFNKISTNNADGYVDGFLNSLRIAKMSSNVISIDSGLLSIQGFRSVNDTLATYTVSVTPSEPIPFQLVATYSHYISDENDTLEITTRPVQELRREPLFSGQNAVYEVELAEFNMTADGIADFKVTLEKIVYNEQDLSELLDKVTKAEQDSATALEKVKELETQVIEKQGTAVYIGGAAQSRVNFTSDPQTQIAEAQSDISDIVSGAQTVGKAEQDANGNVIDETYAKLTQVVRTDTAQSLTDAQKNTVAQNIERSALRAANNGQGWYNILTADVNGYFVADLSVVSSYSNSEPTEVKIIAIGGYTVPGLTATRASITCFSGGALSPSVSKVRVRSIEGQICIDIYIPHNTTTYFNNMKVVLNSWKDINDTMPQMQPFTFIGTEDGTDNVSICEVIPKGISTNGQIYQQGAPVFATDPSKLAPSTANGWTQTTTSGSLPGAGIYMIAVYHTPGDTQPHHYYNPAILVYDGAVGSCTMTDDTGVLLISMVVTPSGIQLARPVSPGSAVQSTNIYYKRIA